MSALTELELIFENHEASNALALRSGAAITLESRAARRACCSVAFKATGGLTA